MRRPACLALLAVALLVAGCGGDGGVSPSGASPSGAAPAPRGPDDARLRAELANLPTEPWLFAVNEEGRITTRLEGSFGFDAVERAIKSALR